MGGFGKTRRERFRAAGVFEIVGGVDVREEAFRDAEKEEGKSLKRYASVEAMAADPNIEAVIVSTPASLHVPQAFIAARAGKAILVEKPLGPDRAACRELVEYCERNHIPHAHGFSARYAPLYQHARKLITDGTLGRVISASGATMHTGGLGFDPGNWRFKRSENPGGPLFQCGIHKIDILRFLFGEGKWLAGYVNRTVTPSATDDAYVLLGTFGGVPCTLHSHYVCSYRHAMEIYGTKGDLFITEFPEKMEHKITNLNSGFEPVHDVTATIPKVEADLDSLRDFALAVRERRQPKMNGREGLNAMELVWEAERISTEIK